MVFHWFSYDFPIFPWFSYGFTMDFSVGCGVSLQVPAVESSVKVAVTGVTAPRLDPWECPGDFRGKIMGIS